MTFPRRQQLRRLRHAARLGLIAGLCAAAALLTVAASPGAALAFAALAAYAALRARDRLGLAQRSAVGARSEQHVRRELHSLVADGWALRHSVPLARGDIDHLATSPTGRTYLIETKTRTVTDAHRHHARRAAYALKRRGPATPVLCVVRARGIAHHDDIGLVASADRLAQTLRRHDAGLPLHPAITVPSPARALALLRSTGGSAPTCGTLRP